MRILKKVLSIIISISIITTFFLCNFLYAQRRKVYTSQVTSAQLAKVYEYNYKINEIMHLTREKGITTDQLNRILSIGTLIARCVPNVPEKAISGLDGIIAELKKMGPTELSDKFGIGALGSLGGGSIGGFIGGAIGLIFGPPGMVIGAGIGAAVGGIPTGYVSVQKSVQEKEKKYKMRIEELYAKTIEIINDGYTTDGVNPNKVESQSSIPKDDELEKYK